MITIDPPSSPSIALNKPTLTRFLNRARAAIPLQGSVSVLLTTDAELKRLNRTFRNKNKPTDVLSFPADPIPGLPAPHQHAGDLAISLDTAGRQAAEHAHPLADELRILLLHGLLHLSGLDHEIDQGEMANRESDLRTQLRLPNTLIARTNGQTVDKQTPPTPVKPRSAKRRKENSPMSLLDILALAALLTILSLAAYVDRVYSEMGKFLAREYQDNIDSWQQTAEPRLRLGRESIALSASVLRQLTLAAIALLFGLRLYTHTTLLPQLVHVPGVPQIFRGAFELILLILTFDRLIPQILFARTRGLWIRRITLPLQALFYLILPITLLLGLLLSIAALAEPEDTGQPEDQSEAMDALLEAGEEEGILEQSDRELVRSVVEFGDKLVREIMTPRPEIFAVPGTLTLQQFTAELEQHAFSRVPVYQGSLDNITGIAFAHDLLQVLDIEAASRSVSELQRPANFVPETKNTAELLREMQREKQHMSLVIDEYGAVAGLVTIEDLLEAIVGEISDEHDEPEDEDTPIPQPDGSYIVTGTFELSRLRDLFREDARDAPADIPTSADSDDQPSSALPAPHPPTGTASSSEDSEFDPTPDYDPPGPREEPVLPQPHHYEATTLGGLVSEIAGHIPLPGEVVEQDGLRMEVLNSTDRRIDRLRVSLSPAA